MKTTVPLKHEEQAPKRQVQYPEISKRFVWLFTIGIIWLIVGLYVDGWTHNNFPALIESFFTPSHAVLYSGYGLIALLLGVSYVHNVRAGYRWQYGLPRPFFLSLIGVLLFALAANVDMIWHQIFGFEDTIEVLLSPAHLALAAGGVIMASGLLRAKWQQSTGRDFGRWRDFMPIFLSYFCVLAIITFFGQFANAIAHPQIFTKVYPGTDTYLQDITLVSAVLLPTGTLMGFILMLLRRWNLPFGTITAIWFGNSFIMLAINSDETRRYVLILLAPLAAGLIGDMLLAKIQTAELPLVWLRTFSFLLPFLSHLLMFLILIGLYDGIWWRIHMWLGVTFIAGLFGLGLSYLLLPPASPAKSIWYERLAN